MHAMLNRLVMKLGVILALVAFLKPGVAYAYPWMIRHHYTGCTACHTDPSGGNLLTSYGRSLSQTYLASELLAKRDEEPSKFKDFAFGLVPLPEDTLAVGAFLRSGYVSTRSGGKTLDSRLVTMRADLEAHVAAGDLRMNASVGVLPGGSAASAREAWVNRASAGDPAIVARTFWAGYSFADGDAVLRAGRMVLPFGLRNVEHTAWVRSETHTDLNQHQQTGASLYWSNDNARLEVMGVAGNFQLRPDDLRERGLVGYGELRIGKRATVAAQAQVLRSARDRLFGTNGALVRQSYGAFYRAALLDELALMVEVNALATSFEGAATELGHVAFAQADYEPLPGLHVMGTLEEKRTALAGAGQGVGAWLSTAWFPVPHVELRGDGIVRQIGGTSPTLTLLFQGQLYL